MIRTVISAVMLLIILIAGGCQLGNAQTPAGYVGYVYHRSIFGSAGFSHLQTGPTSTGLSWKTEVTNVSVTPYNADIEFRTTDKGDNAVVAKDKLKMQFTVHVVWQVKPDRVREYVEEYAVGSGSSDEVAANTFAHIIFPMVNTYSRTAIESYKGLDLKDHQADIANYVESKAQAATANTPFQITKVTVGAITPPQSVQDQISEIQRLRQVLPQKDNDIETARQHKEVLREEALGIKAAMDDLKSELTDEYLQWVSIKIQRLAKDAKNHETIYWYERAPMTGTLPVMGDQNSSPAPAPKPQPAPAGR